MIHWLFPHVGRHRVYYVFDCHWFQSCCKLFDVFWCSFLSYIRHICPLHHQHCVVFPTSSWCNARINQLCVFKTIILHLSVTWWLSSVSSFCHNWQGRYTALCALWLEPCVATVHCLLCAHCVDCVYSLPHVHCVNCLFCVQLLSAVFHSNIICWILDRYLISCT